MLLSDIHIKYLWHFLEENRRCHYRARMYPNQKQMHTPGDELVFFSLRHATFKSCYCGNLFLFCSKT